MVKYTDYALTFAEVPDEINLCFSISNCQNCCPGCHSAFLREDIGKELDMNEFIRIVNKYKNEFTCICFLGEGNDKTNLQKLISIAAQLGYKTCLYSGRDNVRLDEYSDLSYFKIGSYKEELGPLNNSNTNQHMFKKEDSGWSDITYKFFPKPLGG